MRRLVQLLVAIVFLGFGFAIAITRVIPLQDAIVHRMARKVLTTSRDYLFQDDALRVLACGTRSPMPDHDRAGACVAVFAGGRFYVVDTGPNAWDNFALWRIPGDKVGAVFFTHYHSDHIGDLGEFNLQTWGAGRPGPLRVFGPPGVDKVVDGFTLAYELDRGYRTAHHGPEVMNPAKGLMEAHPFDIDDKNPAGTVVLEENGLVVHAFHVDHAPVKPAVGYRFDYKGRSVGISGDTKPTPSLVAASKNVDVLFHEAQANFIVNILQEEATAAGKTQYAHILHDIPNYHTSPVEAAQEANEAGAGLLVLYHLTPPPTNPILERIFLRGVSDVRPSGVVVSRDGLLVTLPAGGKQIETGHVE
ncbi:MAG TPA: MBL fold metallo-hydrolase [Candidatus Binatia bacterium]|jgi:ribonuclease Z